MKKSLVLMAMASVTLAGCVNDVADVHQNLEQKKVKIAFESPVLYDNADSRANYYYEIGSYTHNGSSDPTVTYPKEENFRIYAITHATTITGWPSTPSVAAFNGSEISYDINVDGWAPKNGDKYYYWPSTGYMSFAASSPANLGQASPWTESNRTFTTDGLTIVDFTVPSTLEEQYDLLYSDPVYNKTSSSMSENSGQYTYEGVTIPFHHALTSVHVSISKEADYDDDVKLTDLSLSGVYYQGTFRQNLTGQTGVKDWTIKDGSTTTSYTLLENGAIDFPEVVGGMHLTSLLLPPGKKGYVLIMPQTLTNNTILRVNYTINGSPQHKDIVLNGLNGISEWEKGKRYTYHLYIDGESAADKKIYFAPSTEGWIDGGTITIELD